MWIASCIGKKLVQFENDWWCCEETVWWWRCVCGNRFMLIKIFRCIWFVCVAANFLRCDEIWKRNLSFSSCDDPTHSNKFSQRQQEKPLTPTQFRFTLMTFSRFHCLGHSSKSVHFSVIAHVIVPSFVSCLLLCVFHFLSPRCERNLSDSTSARYTIILSILLCIFINTLRPWPRCMYRSEFWFIYYTLVQRTLTSKRMKIRRTISTCHKRKNETKKKKLYQNYLSVAMGNSSETSSPPSCSFRWKHCQSQMECDAFCEIATPRTIAVTAAHLL